MSHLKTPLLPPPAYNIIGHRGAGKLAPENTLISFKLAKTLGLNWVEFDAQVCGSGEWVVIHDNTLDRTSNGTGLVQETDLNFLKTLDAGSWFDPSFCQENIPLLSETLALLAELNMQPNIEIKGPLQQIQAYLAGFLEILKTHWPHYLPPPLISSYHSEILVALQQTNPELLLGYLVEEINSDTLTIMSEYQFTSLHCHYCAFNGNDLPLVNLCQLPFSVLLYTVDEPRLAKGYFQQGISAIFSDFPNLWTKV